MNSELEQLKLYKSILIADAYETDPALLEAVKERSSKIVDQFFSGMDGLKEDKEKGIELMAISLSVIEINIKLHTLQEEIN